MALSTLDHAVGVMNKPAPALTSCRQKVIRQHSDLLVISQCLDLGHALAQKVALIKVLLRRSVSA
ncbi:MAG: hypothetical protein ACI8WM_000338 [Burkholderiaceae bacterium]|jgi:hypothetical protein